MRCHDNIMHCQLPEMCSESHYTSLQLPSTTLIHKYHIWKSTHEMPRKFSRMTLWGDQVAIKNHDSQWSVQEGISNCVVTDTSTSSSSSSPSLPSWWWGSSSSSWNAIAHPCPHLNISLVHNTRVGCQSLFKKKQFKQVSFKKEVGVMVNDLVFWLTVCLILKMCY